MSEKLVRHSEKKAFRRAVTAAAIDLFTRKKHGNMGDIAYHNGGGKLFEDFVKANENYALYTGEINNITTHKDSIARDVAGTERAIIVGPGPASSFKMKEMQILQMLPDLKEVHIVDVNREFNRQARKVVQEYAKETGRSIRIRTYQMDFCAASIAVPPGPHTTVFSTGSLVSNVPNAPLCGFPDHEVGDFMQGFARLAGVGGKIVLGYDAADETTEDQADPNSAYNESLAPFIKNIMKVLSDYSHGMQSFNPDPDLFRYEAEWIKRAGQVAHKLIFAQPQSFEIRQDDRHYPFHVQENDEFIVMSSLKPTIRRLTSISSDYAGMETQNVYTNGHIVEQVFTVKRAPVIYLLDRSNSPA